MPTDRDLEEHSIKQGTSHHAGISLWSSWGQWTAFCLCLVGWSLRTLRAGRLNFKAPCRVFTSFTTERKSVYLAETCRLTRIRFLSFGFYLQIEDLRFLRTAVRLFLPIKESGKQSQYLELNLTQSLLLHKDSHKPSVPRARPPRPARSRHHVALWDEGVRGGCTVFTQIGTGAADGANRRFWW